MLWIALLVLAAAASFGAWSFNRLVSDRNLIAQAFADVDVQLKRRADLVPALVEAVKAYASHERTTLVAIGELRRSLTATAAAGPNASRFELERNLGDALGRMVMMQENYPALKADANFRDLSARLVDIEEQLQFARRFYNGAVMQYVTRLQSFPDLIVGRLFSFKLAAFFQTDQREAVEVRL